MPFLRIETNVPKEKVPKDFLPKTAELVAKLLSKPLSYCVVSIHPDTMMSWGGTSEPCGFASLTSIGGLGSAIDVEIADDLHRHFKQHLGIQDKRLYIQYNDVPAENLSYEGKSFRKIFGNLK